MKVRQLLTLGSIGASLLVGIWLPLRMLKFPMPAAIDYVFAALISAASVVNLRLYVRAPGKARNRGFDLVSLGALADAVCLLPLWLVQPSLVWVNALAVRHVWRIKGFLDEFDSLQPVVYRLVPIGLMMPLLVHLVACAWIALGSGTAGPDADRTFEYIKGVYWAFTTLATVGYGDISAKTAPQMLYACGVQVVGVGLFGFVLSNVASLLSRMDAAREHHMDNLDRAETFMRSHHIPQELRSRIRNYYHYLWRNQRGYNDRSLVNELPTKLQSDLYFFINRSIIEKVSFFKHAEREMLGELMNELKPRIFAPGERIFKAGDPGDALYFIHNGSVEIVGADQELIARLDEGSCFGEMALISDKPRNATARAESFCHAYTLSKEAFERVIVSYPSFRAHLEQVAGARWVDKKAA